MILSGEHFVLFDQVDHPVPAILGRFFTVARPLIGAKTVRRAGIDVKLCRLTGALELLFHRLDLLDLNAGIVSAIEAKQWFLHLAGKFERVLRLPGAICLSRSSHFPPKLNSKFDLTLQWRTKAA